MKKLDFNSLKKPALELTMKDEARTVLHVTAPKTETLERLSRTLPELKDIINSNDMRGINAIYDLAAELISINEEGKQTAGEQIRAEFGLDLGDLLVFFNAYLDFINEIKSAKN